MAEANQDQDKSEKATPFKLKEARNKGQVAKSMELNSLLMLSTVLVVLYVYGESLIVGQMDLSAALLSKAHTFNFDLKSLTNWYETFVYLIANLYAPFIGAIVIISILSNLIQTGPIFSFHPIKPDIEKINPIAGFKRLFSVKLLFESVKSVIKLCIFTAVLYFAIKDLMPNLYSLMGTSPKSYAAIILDSTLGILFKILILYVLIAAIDVAFTRWKFAKDMRMSRKEIKDELKRREGDPQIKARRRELQAEAMKRSEALQKVPEADVLITNPTHLSIAVVYKRGKMAAPMVIAKGAGEMAHKMRDIAYKHKVPINENKNLARKLFEKVDIDAHVPEQYFAPIARILIKIYAERNVISQS